VPFFASRRQTVIGAPAALDRLALVGHRFLVRHIREADINEVLRAGLHFDQATQQAITSRRSFSVWLMETADDIGDIGAQLQGESAGADAGRVGKISELYDGWVRWLHGGHEKALADLRSHAHLKSMLHQKQTFATRAIIFDDAKQIHDGRHRLFALYEFALGGGELPLVEAFWNRRP
jgi:hypothetical protein